MVFQGYRCAVFASRGSVFTQCRSTYVYCKKTRRCQNHLLYEFYAKKSHKLNATNCKSLRCLIEAQYFFFWRLSMRCFRFPAGPLYPLSSQKIFIIKITRGCENYLVYGSYAKKPPKFNAANRKSLRGFIRELERGFTRSIDVLIPLPAGLFSPTACQKYSL